MPVSIDDFLKLDIRVGTVRAAEPLPQARQPALWLSIDFGAEIGERQSSARITEHYTPAALIGRQVVAVINLPPRQIGHFFSQVLVLGLADANGAVVLLKPDQPVPDGQKLF